MVYDKHGRGVLLNLTMRPWITTGLPFVNEQDFPDQDRNHSFCRNPARSQTRPWCYISDQHTSAEFCIIPRCPTVENLNVLSGSVINIYLTWIFSLAVNGGQITCYWLDLSQSDPTVVILEYNDFASRCDMVNRYMTLVCSWRVNLYDEDESNWYLVTVDCGPVSTSAPITTTEDQTTQLPTDSSTDLTESAPPPATAPNGCGWRSDVVYSDQEVRAMVERITEMLAVPKNNLSSSIRSKKSAEDSRSSAVSTGVVGLVLTGLAGMFIFGLDIMTVMANLRHPTPAEQLASERMK
ncbi:tyrosine-protein kinase receptor [Plakobranchus ocellatus]|uniref:Tyrosine-protein kinase receptor n=1 Tax=Plakobranchus ocellatus TaxID=259542 RepID=A0AAV3YSA8_9GAST|nr:tyrosine-protein kinase receptor [Plakobranchus ocellatus]